MLNFGVWPRSVGRLDRPSKVGLAFFFLPPLGGGKGGGIPPSSLSAVFLDLVLFLPLLFSVFPHMCRRRRRRRKGPFRFLTAYFSLPPLLDQYRGKKSFGWKLKPCEQTKTFIVYCAANDPAMAPTHSFPNVSGSKLPKKTKKCIGRPRNSIMA